MARRKYIREMSVIGPIRLTVRRDWKAEEYRTFFKGSSIDISHHIPTGEWWLTIFGRNGPAGILLTPELTRRLVTGLWLYYNKTKSKRLKWGSDVRIRWRLNKRALWYWRLCEGRYLGKEDHR